MKLLWPALQLKAKGQKSLTFVVGLYLVWCKRLRSLPHLPRGSLLQGGGGVEVRNFSQFSAISQFFAIFRNFPLFSTIFRNFSAIAFGLSTLRACWCLLPLRTTVTEQ